MAYTDVEKRILDMWPKFEDGSYVWFGDAYSGVRCDDEEVVGMWFRKESVGLVGPEGFCTKLNPSEHVKRPAPKVLDADGVEIKVGDTVWVDDVSESCEVVKVENVIVQVQYADGDTFECCSFDLTHKQPDSFERLEEDATMSPWSYCYKHGLVVDRSDGESITTTEAFAIDLVRRAKKLAEKEAAR